MSFGRGGAGNISFAEASEQERKLGPRKFDDLEANSRPDTAYTVSISGGPQLPEKGDEYIHTGRGGTGNVISQAESKQRQNSAGFLEEASPASTTETDPSVLASADDGSSPQIAGAAQLRYHGRGGAGNFVPTSWENSNGGDMEMQQRRESEVKEKVAMDVEKGLPKPDKVHDPYR